MLLVWIAIFWIAPIFIGYQIGKSKNRAGWLWGLLLGWLGVIIVAVLSDTSPGAAALTEKQRAVAELEADVKLAELQNRKAALQS